MESQHPKEIVISSTGDFLFVAGDYVGCCQEVVNKDGRLSLKTFFGEVVEVHFEEIPLFSKTMESGDDYSDDYIFNWEKDQHEHRFFTPEMKKHIIGPLRSDRFSLSDIVENLKTDTLKDRLLTEKRVGPDTMIKQRRVVSATLKPVQWAEFPSDGTLRVDIKEIHHLGRPHMNFVNDKFNEVGSLPIMSEPYPKGARVRRFCISEEYDFDCTYTSHYWIIGNVVGFKTSEWSSSGWPFSNRLYPNIYYKVKIDKLRSAFNCKYDNHMISEIENDICRASGWKRIKAENSEENDAKQLELLHDWKTKGEFAPEHAVGKIYTDSAEGFELCRFPAVTVKGPSFAKEFLKSYRKAYLDALKTFPLFSWTRETIKMVKRQPVVRHVRSGRFVDSCSDSDPDDDFWFCFTYRNNDDTGNSYLSKEDCHRLDLNFRYKGSKNSHHERFGTTFLGDEGKGYPSVKRIDVVGDVVYTWPAGVGKNGKPITRYVRERDCGGLDLFVHFVKSGGKAKRFQGKRDVEFIKMFENDFDRDIHVETAFWELVKGYLDPSYEESTLVRLFKINRMF